jgi:putative ABC transport system ATP-binding protein
MTDAIKTKNLSKIYSMGEVKVTALNEVSISIEEGEFVSIMGPSGSGKSTLMHLLGLLDDPSKGEIVIDGTNTSDMTADQKSEFRLEKIGFVFQFYSLLKGFNSLEQVYMPLVLDGVPEAEARKRSREALENVGLGDRIQHSPDELSGGQRQRVAVARALAGDPEILLADESTSQLDTDASEEMMQLYRNLAEQGQTVVTVNHEKELGEEADRVIWLEDGKLSEYKK